MTVVSQRAILPHKDHYLDLDPTYTDDNGDPLNSCNIRLHRDGP